MENEMIVGEILYYIFSFAFTALVFWWLAKLTKKFIEWIHLQYYKFKYGWQVKLSMMGDDILQQPHRIDTTGEQQKKSPLEVERSSMDMPPVEEELLLLHDEDDDGLI